MNIHDMTEVAYKNGYEAGKKEAQDEIEKLTVELVGMRGACESYKMHYENAQAEIERLKKAIKVQDIMIEQQDYKLKSAKSETVKEFVKKFERKIKNVQVTLGQTWEIQNALKDTLKEMTERGEGK